MVQLVSRHSCVADRLPVVVRFPAGPRVRLKTVDPPKGNRLGPKKNAEVKRKKANAGQGVEKGINTIESLAPSILFRRPTRQAASQTEWGDLEFHLAQRGKVLH